MTYLLDYAIKNKCSDIHITVNKHGKVRERGNIVELTKHRIVNESDIKQFIEKYIPFIYSKFLNMHDCDIDTSFEYSGRRFRANIYKSISGVNLALRLLGETIPSIEDLSLPQSVNNFTTMHTGLVLVVGTTGSGKSTTLAAMINTINNNSNVNIITVEDPIEYIYTENKARIEQREVGTHVKSFSDAVRGAMRQDPDIILVGELRDLETIQNTITLAETGHLVFGTLHAKSVCDTVDRIIDVFPPSQQEQIRVQLSSVLRGIIHQRLMRNNSGGIIPLVELLMVDDVISSMIKQRQKSNTLRDYLRSKKDMGSVHLVDNIVWHCNNGSISLEAIKNLLSPDDYMLAKSIIGSQSNNRR